MPNFGKNVQDLYKSAMANCNKTTGVSWIIFIIILVVIFLCFSSSLSAMFFFKKNLCGKSSESFTPNKNKNKKKHLKH